MSGLPQPPAVDPHGSATIIARDVMAGRLRAAQVLAVRMERHAVSGGRLNALVDFLRRGIDGARFTFCVVSAAPREVVESALAGVVPPDHIFGTEFDYDGLSGEVRAIRRVVAGYGKVAVIEQLESRLQIAPDRP